MGALGVIVNSRARRARRDPALVDRLREIPHTEVRTTAGPDEVAPAIDSLRRAGIDTLLCVGGDGTVAGTLTPLLRHWPHASLPAVALVQGGTINTIAKSLEASDDPVALARGLASEAKRDVTRRPAVRVRADEGEPHYGLAFVNGVGVRFLELYHAEPRLGVLGAANVVAKISASALVRGSLARRAFAPFPAAVCVDGDHLEPRDYTIMGGSSIRHIGLGFAPFFDAGRDPERIHFAVTQANALEIVAALPGIRSGRPSPALEHYLVQTGRIETRTPEPWSLDGDVHPPARRIEVVAGPTLELVSLAE